MSSQPLLVVGSLAYDSIQTPSGVRERLLGGSANYFSIAASLFTEVRAVGVIGEDYGAEDLAILESRKVDTRGLIKKPGKTFFWQGKYEGDLNEAQTLKTELNVFEHFTPDLPAPYRETDILFLANIDPDLQHQVLDQVMERRSPGQKPKFIALDSMNLWIDIKKPSLLKILSRIDALFINEGEAKKLTGKAQAVAAADAILEMGPGLVIIKRGEYGFIMKSKADPGFFMLPAFPISEVIDPTGAGDSFAGGFMGYLAQNGKTLDLSLFKKAAIFGTCLASFTVQDFGLAALLKATPNALKERVELYKTYTQFSF